MMISEKMMVKDVGTQIDKSSKKCGASWSVNTELLPSIVRWKSSVNLTSFQLKIIHKTEAKGGVTYGNMVTYGNK